MTKKKNNKRLYIYLGLALLVLLIFAIVKGQSKPKGTSITYDKATLRTIREKVNASGKIFPEKEIKISSDVSGEIVELYVKEGDSVKAGQLLARINPDQYQSAVERGNAGVQTAVSQQQVLKSQIDASKASVSQTEAQLVNQSKIHDRNKILFKEGVISQQDFDASLASLESLKANLRSAQSNLNTAIKNAEGSRYGITSAQASLKEMKTSLQRTSIYSPVNGIVSKLNVERGERVVGTMQMAGTEMMRIANLSSLEVQVEVSENDILRVKLGDSAEIEAEAYLGRKFKGHVTEIANSANNITSTTGQVTLSSDQVTNFVVKIRIDPASYKELIVSGKPFPFRPGMSASVEINTNTLKDVIAVPIQSVASREMPKDTTNKTANASKEPEVVVFILNKDRNKVSMKPVKTGIQDDSYIQITDGLKEGEEVVTGPYFAVSKELNNESTVNIEKKENENGGPPFKK